MERLSHLMNRVPQLLLRSPLHGLMSSRYLLITFAGRKRAASSTPRPLPTSARAIRSSSPPIVPGGRTCGAGRRSDCA